MSEIRNFLDGERNVKSDYDVFNIFVYVCIDDFTMDIQLNKCTQRLQYIYLKTFTQTFCRSIVMM